MNTGGAFDGDSHRQARTNTPRLTLGYRSLQAEGMHLDQRCYRRTGGDILAGIRVSLPDHSGYRRVKNGVSKLLSCDFQFRPPLREQRLAVSRLLQRILVFGFGDLVSKVSRIKIGLRQQPLCE